MTNISCKILLRNDLSSNWTESNPILDKGEIALVRQSENDLFQTLKIGNGQTTFNDLPDIILNKPSTEKIELLDPANATISDIADRLNKIINALNNQ